MVNIDIPTAIAAVLLSAVLGLFRDNVTEVVQTKLKDRRSTYQEQIEWLEETQAIAERIRNFVIAAAGQRDAIDEMKETVLEDIKEEIRSINSKSAQSVEEIMHRVESIEGIEYEIEELSGIRALPQEQQNEALKQELLKELDRDFEERFRESFREKTKGEMYGYFNELNDHFAQRPDELNDPVINDPLINHYADLESQCYMMDIMGFLSEKKVEKIKEITDDLIDECERAKEELEDERGFVAKIRQRIAAAVA